METQINIRIPDELVERVDLAVERLSRKRGYVRWSRSALIRFALDCYLRDPEAAEALVDIEPAAVG